MGERPSPQYELELVQLATAIRVNERPAMFEVRKHFESLRKPMSPQRAKDYVISMLVHLQPNELVETKTLPDDFEGHVLADIYGVRNEAGDWYLKFYALNGQFFVSSCHPPSGPLRRVDGLVIGRRRR
jgi:hypothetical protein